jgi:hypothetical protein
LSGETTLYLRVVVVCCDDDDDAFFFLKSFFPARALFLFKKKLHAVNKRALTHNKTQTRQTDAEETHRRAKKKRENNITKNPRWRKDLAEEEEEKKKEKELRKLFFQQNLLPNRKSKRDKRNVEAFWKR